MTALDDLAATPFHDADAPLRARMLSRLADTELSVALTDEPIGDRIELRLFQLEHGPVALACDAEDRLAGFFGGPVAYAALPGRVLAGLLRTEGAGLLVNPGHRSEMLLDAAMLDWLSGALSAAPRIDQARLHLTGPMPGTVEALAEPLGARLADMRGLIAGAWLAGVDGATSHLLVIVGAAPEHQDAIAKAMSETLAFLPAQPGGVDISFSDAPPVPAALRFDLGAAEVPVLPKRQNGPPILR